MVAFGVIGSSFFGLQRDVVLAPGETYDIADYKIISFDPVKCSDEFRLILEK